MCLNIILQCIILLKYNKQWFWIKYSYPIERRLYLPKREFTYIHSSMLIWIQRCRRVTMVFNYQTIRLYMCNNNTYVIFFEEEYSTFIYFYSQITLCIKCTRLQDVTAFGLLVTFSGFFQTRNEIIYYCKHKI